MSRYESQRNFLKTDFTQVKNIKTDRMKGVPQPLVVKPFDPQAEIIPLPDISNEVLKKKNISDCIKDRRSIRLYSKEALSLKELSYLLWATQGITGTSQAGLTFKTVPCSGATHSFETYLFIMNVEGLKKGVYRYLPVNHDLIYLFDITDIEQKIDEVTLDQPFVPNFAKKAGVLFAWSTIPYRSEWKFDITAHKKILIDIGHVCQNLYLAGESLNAGTCAIGIYDQKMIDQMLGLNGEDEFIIYLAAVGKKRE